MGINARGCLQMIAFLVLFWGAIIVLVWVLSWL